MVEVADPYDELAAYTLTRGDQSFIHQHVADTRAIRTATPETARITVAQALVGLYLHVEHGFTGRQVQRVHQLLANERPEWPAFSLPDDRGRMRVAEVLAEPPGERRDGAIHRWARSTWEACSGLRNEVAAFLSANGITVDRR